MQSATGLSQAPFHAQKIHFIGIGGAGMSGLAGLLLGMGREVSGSDPNPSELTEQLCDKGAALSYIQGPENLSNDLDLIITTAALHEQNPELREAKRRLPYRRVAR